MNPFYKALPEAVELDGALYPIATDFRDIVQLMEMCIRDRYRALGAAHRPRLCGRPSAGERLILLCKVIPSMQ